ncbi:MFS transporter [Nocardia salmonicida]|uniref:MFS transporter n=1 Tax=Nocardia salmonicida TaxID=53431 RepID=UPI0037B6A0BF
MTISPGTEGWLTSPRSASTWRWESESWQRTSTSLDWSASAAPALAWRTCQRWRAQDRPRARWCRAVVSLIGYSAFAARPSVRTRTAVILAAIAATTMLLGIFTTTAALTIAAVLSGMARGVFTLLQATAITDRWDSIHYGQLTGLLSAPMTITVASAPFAVTALASGLGGYPGTFLILGIAATAAAALSLTTIPKPSRKEKLS